MISSGALVSMTVKSIRRSAVFALCCLISLGAAHAQPVVVEVDAEKRLGPLEPIWSYFGYDEPNYTYMKDGRKLLSELAALSPAPVYVRAHNLLTTGDGSAALKWGSSNAYTEDAAGNPVYDWRIVDRIFDTYVDRGMRPLVEIGFMPKALSVQPEPYRHDWGPDRTYNSIFTGWAHPPRDYERWAELVYQWALHCIDRYGREEVETWLWEPWNEPNIGYWQGTSEEYHKLYDYTADALRRALPNAVIGGPHSTGPRNERAAEFLRGFLEHVVRGTNYVSGETGSPIDYIGFHAKGRPRVVDGHVRMGSESQLADIDRGFGIVASFPELKDLPVIIGESDPEGCAACSARFHPQNAYRNGTMYSSYTAAVFARKYDLAARHGVNLRGAVTWAFEFEDQPYFDGFRDLATNGIDKPVLNVFRMFGLLGPERVQASSTGAAPLEEMLESGVKGDPDINVLAGREARSVAVMVWNYHDDDLPAPAAEVEVRVDGLGAERVLLHHYRVDERHGNAYAAWKLMGSPQSLDEGCYRELEGAGKLELTEAPEWRDAGGGTVTLRFALPRQAVSLLKLSW